MPFGFDPRKLIKEDNDLEADKEIKEAIKKTLTFDEQIEENENTIRKRSNIAENFSEVDKALREVNFVEKDLKNLKTGKVKLCLANWVGVRKLKL